MTHILPYGDGLGLSYTEFGDQAGEPILVQHGLIASIEDGDLFTRLIQAGKRVICVARPGYGASSPYVLRDIAEWADSIGGLVGALGLSRFDVLGMSSGAPYSYALGYRFPDKVRNLYIFSGTPALYDPAVQAHWPFPLNREATLPELQRLVPDLFFSNLAEADRQTNAIRDSMANQSFGPALDFWLRCRAWGFRVSEVRVPVKMQHSRGDANVPLITAEVTAKQLPDCTLVVRDTEVHFSEALLDEFIRTTMLG